MGELGRRSREGSVMATDSNIAWTDHTYNPWWGCERISPGCDHCYAADLAKRFGYADTWEGEFRFFGDKHWLTPKKWDREATLRGEPYRVFCGSMCDWADNRVPPEHRIRLWELVRETQNIKWLMLTKRIGNVPAMLPDDWGNGYENVTLMITVVNQDEANRDIPKLLRIPARCRGISYEPALGPVDFRDWLYCLYDYDDEPHEQCPALDWVIFGGESGPGFRQVDVGWARDVRDHCNVAGVAFFMKQMSGNNQSRMQTIPDDLMIREFPR